MPKSRSIRHFGKRALKIFIIFSVAWILRFVLMAQTARMETEVFPRTSFFILFSTLLILQIALEAGAVMLFIWHGFRGGYLLFGLSLIRLRHSTEETAAIFEKRWNSWRVTKSRFMNVCLVLSMAFVAVLGLVVIAMILWANFEVHALP